MSRLGRYNLTRYNIPDGASQRITISMDGYATLTAAFSVGVQVLPLIRFAVSLTADAKLRWGYFYADTHEAAMTAAMTLRRLWSPNFTAPAELDAALNWSLTIRPLPVSYDTAFDADAALGPMYYRRMDLAAELATEMQLVADIHPVADVYSALDAAFSLESSTEVVMAFTNLSLSKNARLVIDTENCTATLTTSNGVTNVIQYYSGDWPWISRLLRGFEVTSMTSGALDVRIMYRERYL